MKLNITATLSPQLRTAADGVISRGVKEAVIDENGHLMFLLTDNTTVDLGRVVGADGAPGTPGLPGTPGQPGAKGETGNPGVYCGPDEPTDPAITVWIDPTNGGVS